MLKLKICTLATLLLLAMSPAQADVYKCVKSGKTTFSDTPCEMGTPPIQSKTGNASSAGDSSPKLVGITTCTREAGSRAVLGAQGRIDVAAVTDGEMEAVTYAGASIPARRYHVSSRLIPQGGGEAQSRDTSFTCFTSEDGQRVLKDAKAYNPEGRSTKTQSISAPARDNSLSDPQDKKKGHATRPADDAY